MLIEANIPGRRAGVVHRRGVLYLAIMKPFWSSAVAFATLVFAGASQAEPRRSTQGAETAQTPEVLPPTGGADGPAADTAEERKKAAPVVPAAGYAYNDRAASNSRVPHGRYRHSGPVVQMPGFEPTPDGGSRLFVQLSQSVPVEERKARGSITYVLKGASPRVWNNTNALVTVHFNTPVSRARLVPHGADLLFIVELRAAAAPTWKMAESQDKTSTLQIEFPKGDYLATATATPANGEAAAAENGTVPPGPAEPRAARGRRGPARQAPAKKP